MVEKITTKPDVAPKAVRSRHQVCVVRFSAFETDQQVMTLEEGWEPFSVIIRASGGQPLLFMRRRVPIRDDEA